MVYIYIGYQIDSSPAGHTTVSHYGRIGIHAAVPVIVVACILLAPAEFPAWTTAPLLIGANA